MKKRLKLKRIRKIDKKGIYLFVIILVFMSIVSILIYINNRVSPFILEYAEVEIKKISSVIINNAIKEEIEKGINIDELFVVVKNNDGDIQTVDFNPIIVNKVLSSMTNTVQNNLKLIEKGDIEFVKTFSDINIDDDKIRQGIIYEVPLGVVSKNAFLSNLGPKIPIKLNIIGHVNSNIKTNLTSYGINNALVEISIYMQVSEKLNTPFMTKNISIESNVPIAIKMVQGGIPSYYGTGLMRESNIFRLPVE